MTTLPSLSPPSNKHANASPPVWRASARADSASCSQHIIADWRERLKSLIWARPLALPVPALSSSPQYATLNGKDYLYCCR